MSIYFYKVGAPYGCFSNFSPHGIHLGGQDWQTVEHYYQAHKFCGTAHANLMHKIQNAPTPEAAAKLGRDRAIACCRSDWSIAKLEVMQEAVYTKFLTHLEIQEILLATGNEIIVEDSPIDYFWGCGVDKTGENQLGKILMNVRQILRDRI